MRLVALALTCIFTVQGGEVPASWAIATADSIMRRQPDFTKAYWQRFSYMHGYVLRVQKCRKGQSIISYRFEYWMVGGWGQESKVERFLGVARASRELAGASPPSRTLALLVSCGVFKVRCGGGAVTNMRGACATRPGATGCRAPLLRVCPFF
jgi:hypothetical protein